MLMAKYKLHPAAQFLFGLVASSIVVLFIDPIRVWAATVVTNAFLLFLFNGFIIYVLWIALIFAASFIFLLITHGDNR